jgi:DNA segregation ATPase FtsK/SpoIIIE, S-DNA-T family
VTRTASRRKKPSRKADDALLPSQRKQEVVGLLLMALAFLLALALLSYDGRDNALASSISWVDALLPGPERAHNLLGLVGAKLSYHLVIGFLGYPLLLFCMLGFAWGYALFRQRQSLYLPILSGLTIAGTVLVAILIGWFADGSEAGLTRFSGEVGLALAGWMKQVFGRVGSLILLFVLLAVVGLLFIDRDIQLTLDRVEATFDRLRGRTAERWEDAKQAHRERVAARAELRAERLAERRRLEEARASAEPASGPTTPAATAPPAGAPAIVPAAPPPPPRDAEPAATHRLPRLHPAGTVDDDDPALTRPAGDDALIDELVAEHTGHLPPPERQPRTAPAGGPAFKVQVPVAEPAGDLRERHRSDAESGRHRFVFPDLELLDAADTAAGVDLAEIEENKQALLDKLETYNVQITEINAVVGPTVTRYELTPAPGIRINRITALQDDLAMAMAAPGIRILAPIPGKSAIGVEIANRHRELVRLSSILGTARFTEAKASLPIALGKNIQGEVHVEDLCRMPHLLMAGATGAGKSVGLNAMIVGLMFACSPRDLKFVMIDPKKIELGPYQQLLDHYIAMPEGSEDPVITDFRDAAGVLKTCEREMEARYDKLAEAGVRGIKEYNEKVRTGQLTRENDHEHLPYIVVIVDELADLMMTSGKEIEPPIARLAQMARAVGIHLILATQRPSVDVITGLIKANFPSRIAYQTASKIDSRTILDAGGAEQLVGNGDMLYMNGSRVVRLQGPFVANDEIERVVEHVARQQGYGPYLLPPLETEAEGGASGGFDDSDRDDLFEEAARVIVRNQQGSVSLLQRKLSVGYTRAARIVDQLEDAGIVGPFEGSKARQVLIGSETELQHHLNDPAE